MRVWLRAEDGFTMVMALGILLVTMLLTAALFNAVQGDASLSRVDLNGKRAYAAAQAGVQAYLYQLNSHASTSQWWETCSNDVVSQTPVPGTTTGTSYSYQPVWANGNTSCNASNTVQSLIDQTTGSLRMQVTGYAGNATRTIVASLRTLSPVSFMWYTKYETLDPDQVVQEGYTPAQAQACNTYYYSATPTGYSSYSYNNLGPPNWCYVYWASGDTVSGPMYTQDQFLIGQGASPTFGSSSSDTIASQVGTNGPHDICATVSSDANPCENANIVGTPAPNVSPEVLLPTDNSNLLTDATKYGTVLTGTTTINVSGTTATYTRCDTASASGPCSSGTINLVASPIIYVENDNGCAPSSGTYNPFSSTTTQGTTYSPTTTTGNSVSPAYYGLCGDVYVSGSYSTPLTISGADDIILTGSLTNSTDPNGTTKPTGTATLGLVADDYVRVMHTCSGNNPSVTIDGAILTLWHSFYVDNFGCGATTQNNSNAAQGTLTVHGAIAQYYRGAVAQTPYSYCTAYASYNSCARNSGPYTEYPGYLKSYQYDPRFSYELPPYLFDLQNTQWTMFRETLCNTAVASSVRSSCSYTGP